VAISALVSASGSGSAKDEDEPTVNSWFAQTVARGAAGFNINYFWSSGSKFRAETVASGHKIITIVNGDTYYAYDAVLMHGVAIRRKAEAIAADDAKGRPFGNEMELLLGQGAEKIREETLFRIPSEVYQVSDETGRRVIWVSQDSRRLPMRIEIYDRRTGATNYKEYHDWQHGIPIAEKFFEPEPAVTLRHFEFDEYIGNIDNKETMSLAPILYEELLVGPSDKRGTDRSSSPR
jgi:outer membrane lipoprotein-sorting protein